MHYFYCESRINNLKALGIDTEFHLYPNLGHGFGLGGSSFSDTINTIAGLEPNAAVEQEGFTFSRNNVQDAQSAKRPKAV